MKSVLILVMASLMSVSICSNETSAKHEYGSIIIFTENDTLSFDDLSLQYIGNHREEVPSYGEFLLSNFQIWNQNTDTIVSWTDGTGEIAPAEFQFAGDNFRLELEYSLELGMLESNELVLWKD